MMMNMSIEHERDELMSDATLICSKLIFFFFFFDAVSSEWHESDLLGLIIIDSVDI